MFWFIFSLIVSVIITLAACPFLRNGLFLGLLETLCFLFGEIFAYLFLTHWFNKKRNNGIYVFVGAAVCLGLRWYFEIAHYHEIGSIDKFWSSATFCTWHFWQWLLWGGLLGSVLSLISPNDSHDYRKEERNPDSSNDTTNNDTNDNKDDGSNNESGSNIGLEEGLYVEFKQTIIYSSRTGHPNEDRPYEIAKVIASFMNTEGGDLYCGVNDDGYVVGIENDLNSLHKAEIKGEHKPYSDKTYYYGNSLDYFKQKLRNIIIIHLGRIAATYVDDPEFITDEISGAVYVKIHINPFIDTRDNFVYLNDKVFIRTGSQSVLIKGRDCEIYAEKRKKFVKDLRKYHNIPNPRE